jgi:uncharacterized protein (DUF1778 family)
MHTIFLGGIATGRFAMGSNEPLGAPSPPAEYGTDSQESEIIIIDDLDKPFSTPPAGGKRERGALAGDELQAFTCMTEAVKDAAQAIRENKPTDVHPDLYKAIMDMLDYSPDAPMAALNHLVDHKAQGVTFVAMANSHISLWLRNYLPKNYFNM